MIHYDVNIMMFEKPTKKKKTSKVEVWDKVRTDEIIPQFELWGIRYCELKFEDRCVTYMYLGFAHTKKRRNITTPEDLRRVVLACQPCHDIVEYHCKEYTGMDMTEYLDGVIANREAMLKAKGLLK